MQDSMESIEEIVMRIVAELDDHRYGKYRGFVVDNEDPQARGRLRLTVPSVLADQVTDWALPCMPFGGKEAQGFFMVPEKDAQVWVEFEEGDIDRPIWTGVFWQRGEDLPEGASRPEPTTRMLQTPSGHILRFDDEDGQERIRLKHKADADLVIERDGTITLTDPNGNRLSMNATTHEVVLEQQAGNRITMNDTGTTVEDSTGNRIEMSSWGIAVEGHQVVVRGSRVDIGDLGGEPLIKGQTFLTMFMKHRHTVAPLVGGPTSPPVPQGELSALSTKVFGT